MIREASDAQQFPIGMMTYDYRDDGEVLRAFRYLRAVEAVAPHRVVNLTEEHFCLANGKDNQNLGVSIGHCKAGQYAWVQTYGLTEANIAQVET